MPTLHRSPSLTTPGLFLLLAAVALGALAVVAPYEVTAYGVMILGPLHVLLAARYLTGRVAGAVTPRLSAVVAATIVLMIIVRAATLTNAHLGHVLELFASMGVVSFALFVGLRGTWRWVAMVPLVAAVALTFADMPWYWHFFTHAHNVIPMIFLWDYARGSSASKRAGFVLANLVWMIGIPAIILAGVADPLLNAASPAGVANLVDPSMLVAGAAPPGAPAELGIRFLAAFGFMQSMHYVLWMVFFQTFGRQDAQRSPFFRGAPAWIGVGAICVAIWAAYAFGYLEGRAVYSIFGAINVYLEQPIAVWLLLTALPVAATTPLIARLRSRP